MSNDAQSPPHADDHSRRADFARRALNEIIQKKTGNPSAYCITSVRMEWKAGVLTLVTVDDSVSYK